MAADGFLIPVNLEPLNILSGQSHFLASEQTDCFDFLLPDFSMPP